MNYILDTTTHAKFDNIDDASAYYRQLKQDEPHGQVSKPRRNQNDGLYVVKLTKSETVQTWPR